MPLTDAAQAQIKGILDGTTDPASGKGIAGLVFCAIDKSGEYLTQQASGTIGLDEQKPMDLDSVFWIASCTKMITGVAAMQLVEQGKLDLDSSEKLYEVLPELEDVQVLNPETMTLEEKRSNITLRMLLSHTAGFGYGFIDQRLFNYQSGYDDLTPRLENILYKPLLNQPGSMWEYGPNVDWAGIAIERTTKMSLDAYFKKNIFEPLGIKDMSFLPTESMKKRMVKSHQRNFDGVRQAVEHPWPEPLEASDSEQAKIFNSGGAGCFGRPTEYCQIIATLLNNGTSPTTGARILSPGTVDAMFANQIPQWPDFGRGAPAPAVPELVNHATETYPQEGNPPQGWGLTFFLTIAAGATGRGPNTAFWAGLVNLYWWVDRARGVGGMIAGQLLPFGDAEVAGAWVACEKAVYDGLS